MKSCLTFCREYVDAVYVTGAASATVAGRVAAERAASVHPGPVREIESRGAVPEEHRSGRTIVIDTVRGTPFGRCPGSRGHLCCNYRTVDLYIGCSIGCSYCIMNGYLNYGPLVVQADTGPIVRAIRSAAMERPDRPLRVGSGEVGDSLLLDPVFRLNEEIVEGVADMPNVRYEMKTKTNYVDHLFGAEHKGRAVVGFSLNPDHIVRAEEGIAALSAERLSAAARCAAAGYMVAFHFDPVIRTDAFPDDYLDLIARISAVPRHSIAWISMGTIRFPPTLKDAFADRPFASAEFVPTRDGKLRYLQIERTSMYRTLRVALTEVTGAPIYLCMESPAVWRRVFGALPGQVGDLRDIFDGVGEAATPS